MICRLLLTVLKCHFVGPSRHCWTLFELDGQGRDWQRQNRRERLSFRPALAPFFFPILVRQNLALEARAEVARRELLLAFAEHERYEVAALQSSHPDAHDPRGGRRVVRHVDVNDFAKHHSRLTDCRGSPRPIESQGDTMQSGEVPINKPLPRWLVWKLKFDHIDVATAHLSRVSLPHERHQGKPTARGIAPGLVYTPEPSRRAYEVKPIGVTVEHEGFGHERRTCQRRVTAPTVPSVC